VLISIQKIYFQNPQPPDGAQPAGGPANEEDTPPLVRMLPDDIFFFT
jgi:hypothetical protein